MRHRQIESNHIRVARRIHGDVAQRTGHELPVRLWDGSMLGPDHAPYRIVLNHAWSLRSMLLPPSDLAAGEAYVFGDVDVEGDMTAALEAAMELSDRPLSAGERSWLAAQLMRFPRPPRLPRSRRARLRMPHFGKGGDREAIAFHYDLPNSFFETFLDPEMVYSCGYFTENDPDLAAAQRRKLDVVCRKLRLRPGARLLDIGCGWGSLLAHAAEHYGVTGVGVTLSETQAAAGNASLARCGLTDQVEVRLQDYRDVEGTFDAVASIGMVEHVGKARLKEYMSTVHGLLADGGLFLNHGIVSADPDRSAKVREKTFIHCYVFPGGELTPLWRGTFEAERANFEVLDVEQLRLHYARTLRAWIANLERNRDAAIAAGGESAYRIWRAYMAGSAVAFARNHIGVVQTLLSKNAEVPLGRRWMLPAEHVEAVGPVEAPDQVTAELERG